MKRTFGSMFVGAAGVGATLTLLILAFGDLTEIQIKLLFSIGAVAGFSLLGLCAALWWERDGAHPLVLLGAVVSVGAMVLAVALIWGLLPADHRWTILWRALAVLAGVTAHTALLLLAHGQNRWINIVAVATIVCSWALAGYYIVVLAGALPPTMHPSVAPPLAALTSVGTLLTPLLARVFLRAH